MNTRAHKHTDMRQILIFHLHLSAAGEREFFFSNIHKPDASRITCNAYNRGPDLFVSSCTNRYTTIQHLLLMRAAKLLFPSLSCILNLTAHPPRPHQTQLSTAFMQNQKHSLQSLLLLYHTLSVHLIYPFHSPKGKLFFCSRE